MTDINGIARSPAAVLPVDRQNIENQSSEQNSTQQSNGEAVADTVSISSEALQLSQSIQQAEQPTAQDETQQQPGNQSDSEEKRDIPNFLDIRA